MDNAVALVQTYLRVNGYLTVTEYPVVEALPQGGFQTATDLDVLAFRFGHSCTLMPEVNGSPDGAACPVETDPALDVRPGVPDMIIGEVKEGRATLNRAATNPNVLAAALTRFGCCEPELAAELARRLVRDGHAMTHQHGGGHAPHRVRLIAFGSLPPEAPSRWHQVVLLGDIVRFLREHVRRHWSRLQASESKDPGLSFLMTLEKAERGVEGASPRRAAAPMSSPQPASAAVAIEADLHSRRASTARQRFRNEGGTSHA